MKNKQKRKRVEALEVFKPEESHELKLIEGLLPKYMRINETKNKTDKFKKWKHKIKQKELKYETNKYI